LKIGFFPKKTRGGTLQKKYSDSQNAAQSACKAQLPKVSTRPSLRPASSGARQGYAAAAAATAAAVAHLLLTTRLPDSRAEVPVTVRHAPKVRPAETLLLEILECPTICLRDRRRCSTGIWVAGLLAFSFTRVHGKFVMI